MTEDKLTAEMIEQFARAMFDEWPIRAISPALAEQSGQPIDTPLTWEKVLEMGGNHDGLLRLAKGAAKCHLAMSAAQPRYGGEMVAIVERLKRQCSRAEEEYPRIAAPDGTVAVQFTDLRAILDTIAEPAPDEEVRLREAINQALNHRYGDWTGILSAALASIPQAKEVRG